MNLQTIVDQQSGGFWNWNFLGGGARMTDKVMAIVMIPMSMMFFISFLAETNRPPFDLPEAESELVAGYQVEYSSTPYLLLMLAEYVNITLMCTLISILFFGGWHWPFGEGFLKSWPPIAAHLWALLWIAIKTVFWFFMVAMVKAIVPRYRYDQLMRLGWKVFLPTSLVAVVAVAAWRVFGLQA
jgi:NADH-quinone oxidoreductase subunit H